MGTMYVTGSVRGPKGEETVEFLVDSGAMYSLLPHAIWTAIGLEPRRALGLRLADGTVIDRHVSECEFVLPHGDTHSPVILGEPGDQALLGVVTLENLGVMLNPYKREIVPMQILMMRVG
ncbi:MAG: retroviral-like aspartic protease family protein [Actinomycetota bacterium]